jgi:hypothetical protein
MSMWSVKPKEQRVVGTRDVLRWGRTLGAYGFGFTLEREGPRDPGLIETELTLRRVFRSELGGPELQIGVEITQRYRSGSNSRRMLGSLALRGPSLADFAKLVLFVEGSKALDDAKAAAAEYDETSTDRAVVALRELLKVIEP